MQIGKAGTVNSEYSAVLFGGSNPPPSNKLSSKGVFDMPNWCDTEIIFYSHKINKLRDLHEKMRKIYFSQSSQENDFINRWMSDYANAFFPEIGAEKIDCRGSVFYIDEDINRKEIYFYFKINTQTAWSPKMGLWNEIISRSYAGDIFIAYASEEPGMELYCYHDESQLFYQDSNIYFDLLGDDGVGECGRAGNIKELHKILSAHYNFPFRRFKNIDKLKNAIQNKLSQDEYINFYTYEECHPDEYDFYA